MNHTQVPIWTILGIALECSILWEEFHLEENMKGWSLVYDKGIFRSISWSCKKFMKFSMHLIL